MKLIERCVLKNFIKYMILALAILVFIYIVINLFENLGRYLAKNISLKDILLYYLYLTPSYIILLIPVAAIMATFFVFGFMAKNRELVALKSGGLDINKLLFLILRAGTTIVLLSFIFQETVGVWSQTKLFEHKSERIDKRTVKISEQRRNFWYYGENDWIYYIRDFDGATTIMKGVILCEIGSQQRIKKRIDAETGKYEGLWIFENTTAREFDTLGNETVKTLPILKMAELKERPKDFLKRIKPAEEMNFLEIYKFVRKRARAGEDINKEAVELNYRFSFPIITIILLLICLPLSLVLKRGGIAIGLGLSIVLAFVYWGLIQTCRAYGVAGLMDQFFAAWLPNIIFGTVGILTMLGVRR